MRNKRILIGALVALLALGGAAVFAADNATQTVNFSVAIINEIVVTGAPTLAIVTATAGLPPTAVTNNTSVYSLTTNQTRKITGQLTSAMPTGVTLEITLESPGTGTVLPLVTLNNLTASDLITGITPVASGVGVKTITYRLSATVLAGPVTSTSRDVLLTIAAP